MPDLYLGIDTSNYKTSVAVTDENNRTVFEKSEYLEVPQGSRGLRQSEAFFRHSNRLPDYIDELASGIDVSDIRAAGVSTRPRRVEGSYMPCFLAGINAAREISSVLGIPLHEFSHQEGHAAAIIESGPDIHRGTESGGNRSALFHLSGGTTELLICTPDEHGYSLEISGGTLDISIGQLIDRAGVAMGYPFPSGAYLDRLAETYLHEHGRVKSRLPQVRLKDGYFNLSGLETRILRNIENTAKLHAEFERTDSERANQTDVRSAAIAYDIFERAASLLADSALYAAELLRDTPKTSQAAASDVCSGCITDGYVPRIYMAGGVSASSFIRSSIEEKLREKSEKDNVRIIFGEPALSGDNAVGIARLARRINIQV